MNLHLIVRGAVTTVNPDIAGTHLISTGYTTDATGKNTPTYSASAARLQVQGVKPTTLLHMDSLNIQGVLRQVHMYGDTAGVVRADGKGGDLLNFPQRVGAAVQTWKVVAVLETFPDWSCVVVQLQNVLVTA